MVLSFFCSGRSVGPLFLMMESYVAFKDPATSSLRRTAKDAGEVQ
jgi:hypothetical protein